MGLFEINKIYKRSAIHDQFGGSRQSGISTSAKYPYIFIFTGSSGEQHGYRDGWVNDEVFVYTGEGQVGDMKFTKGNLRLRDHVSSGKRVFLFGYVKKGFVMFVNELELFDFDYFETHDRNSDLRVGIKFFFKKKDAHIFIPVEELQPPVVLEDKPLNYDFIHPNVTEREGLINTRVGQGAYRKSVMHRWRFRCAVTGFDNPQVLIASHIVPWKESTDLERLDVNNGILLSATYDALFDKHLISFDEKGRIILSKELKQYAFGKLNVTGSESIEGFTDENQNYLERHRKILK